MYKIIATHNGETIWDRDILFPLPDREFLDFVAQGVVRDLSESRTDRVTLVDTHSEDRILIYSDWAEDNLSVGAVEWVRAESPLIGLT